MFMFYKVLVLDESIEFQSDWNRYSLRIAVDCAVEQHPSLPLVSMVLSAVNDPLPDIYRILSCEHR